jgi:hypothetical protein
LLFLLDIVEVVAVVAVMMVDDDDDDDDDDYDDGSCLVSLSFFLASLSLIRSDRCSLIPV